MLKRLMPNQPNNSSLPPTTDVLLVGAGIMSATLGTLLKLLDDDLNITIVESLPAVAEESSDAWNNAGTGHAALCELNYTPELKDGAIETSRAIKINEQFQQSRQFWSTLVEHGLLTNPRSFINAVPHMSFVQGAEAVDYLRRRHAALSASPLFRAMEFSTDPAQLREWIPLMMRDRDASVPVAATRFADGTDLDFGSLTRALVALLQQQGSGLYLQHKVTNLTRLPDTRWHVEIEDLATKKRSKITTRFVFLGAGGGALPLLQKSGIPEGRGYGGFPVSGQWLRCTSRSIIEQHRAKVYGKPALGAPPMSVPHLDTRVIKGERELLFGPFAGFSTKFLKKGSFFDLPGSIGTENIVSMLAAGAQNIPLTKYLIGQVMQSQADRVSALRDFIPTVNGDDWKLEIAGQRVQIIKSDPQKGGKLEFGTEIIRSADGSLAALLGASPGASTAVSIMLTLVEKGLTVSSTKDIAHKLQQLIPSYGQSLDKNPEIAEQVAQRTRNLLQLT
jgi:malate dehydrogenase (quinone)